MSEQKEVKIKKRFFYEGVELAVFLGESEGFCRYGEIAEFYGTLINNAFEWFENVKYPEIIEEYKVCDDPQKKFGRAIKYGYFIKVWVSEENGKILSVSCEVCMKNAKEEKIFEFCDVQAWDKELLIMVKKRKTKSKKKVRSALHKKDKSPTEL